MKSSLLVGVAFAVAACSVAPLAGSPNPVQTAVSAVPTRTASTSGPTFTADADGVRLVAVFDLTSVQAGGELSVALALTSTRSEVTTFEEPCYGTTMKVDLEIPAQPPGRDWDGIAGTFKAYALEHGQGTPMESSTRDPASTFARDAPCHAPTGKPGTDIASAAVLAPGETYETVLTWTAELVKNVATTPGEAPFSIGVRYDLEAVANGFITFETIELTGVISVVDGRSGSISAGEVLDVVLGEPAFAAWLEEQPETSWENANLFLQPGGIDTGTPIPSVPYWDVELFRKPRNWAIVLVDALEGTILRTDFCDDPCDR